MKNETLPVDLHHLEVNLGEGKKNEILEVLQFATLTLLELVILMMILLHDLDPEEIIGSERSEFVTNSKLIILYFTQKIV
jgi:hypothetical protein